MKSKLFTLIGFLYVAYAILTANAALVRLEARPMVSHEGGYAEQRQLLQVDRDRRPMDFVDEEVYVGIKGEYRIIVWAKEGCYWCGKFERNELPKLKKSGTSVEVRWYGEDEPEEGQKPVKLFPTIRVYRKNILVKEFVGYTKADEILKVIKYRVVLLR